MHKPEIVPSLIASSQQELDERIGKVKAASSTFQLDVMDGKFAPNNSLNFDFSLPAVGKFEAHLMIEKPLEWIEKHGSKVDTILVHVEPIEDVEKVIETIRALGKKPGLALKPATPVSTIEKYLNLVDEVLIMSVEIGFYGGKFLPETLEKVKALRQLKPGIDIEVDGGMNPKTIGKAYEAGANLFISGSYIMKSDNPKEAAAELRKHLK